MSLNNTSKRRNTPDVTLGFIFSCLGLVGLILGILFIHLLFLMGCASPFSDIDLEVAPSKESEAPLPIEETSQVRPLLDPFYQDDETTLPLSAPMIVRAYQKIAKKISTAEYDKVLDELDQFIDKYTSPQLYVVEAHLLRFIILSGYRAGYLHLANAYHLGWEEILQLSDKKLPVEERIDRLTNLDKTELEYCQKHKEMVIRLIRAYERFKDFYPTIESERLRLMAYPFKVYTLEVNSQLAQIKKGVWLETAERLKAEKKEINNCILNFWTRLMELDKTIDVNRLLAEGPYSLDERTLFLWLSKSLSYQVKEARPGAFTDEPELRRILQSKSAECHNKVEGLLKSSDLGQKASHPEKSSPRE